MKYLAAISRENYSYSKPAPCFGDQMKEGFVGFLFSPMALLFVINAFFLIIVTSFAWRIFFNLDYTRALFKLPKIHDKYSWLLKAGLFFPIEIIAIIIVYYWSSLQHINIFPLFQSSFVKLNLVGFITVIAALMVIKHLNNKSDDENLKVPMFYIAYVGIIYLFTLIIVMTTVITCLNTLPNGLLENYLSPKEGGIMEFVLFALFSLYLLFIFMVVSLTIKGRILVFLAYTIAISFVNYTLHG